MRRLGLLDAQQEPRDERVEGLVAKLDDANREHAAPLDQARLCRWHAALFSTGYSDMSRIREGQYRNHLDTMRIVSGLPGREVARYTAPPLQQVVEKCAACWSGLRPPTRSIKQRSR